MIEAWIWGMGEYVLKSQLYLFQSPTKWRPREVGWEVGEDRKMWKSLRLRTLLKERPCKGGAKSEPDAFLSPLLDPLEGPTM